MPPNFELFRNSLNSWKPVAVGRFCVGIPGFRLHGASPPAITPFFGCKLLGYLALLRSFWVKRFLGVEDEGLGHQKIYRVLENKYQWG